MKVFIAFACLLALTYANEDANVLRYDSEVNPESFKYAYELDTGVKVEQSGTLKSEDVWTVAGDFEYKSPEGEHIQLSYTADDTGYHPDPNSPLLPQPHPIPEHIIRSIAWIQAHTDAKR